MVVIHLFQKLVKLNLPTDSQSIPLGSVSTYFSVEICIMYNSICIALLMRMLFFHALYNIAGFYNIHPALQQTYINIDRHLWKTLPLCTMDLGFPEYKGNPADNFFFLFQGFVVYSNVVAYVITLYNLSLDLEGWIHKVSQ